MNTEAPRTTPPSNIIKKMPSWLRHIWKLYFLGLSVPIGLIVWGVRSIPPGFDMMQNVNLPTYVAPPDASYLVGVGAGLVVVYLALGVILRICNNNTARQHWYMDAQKQFNKYFEFNKDHCQFFSPFLFMVTNPHKDYDLDNIVIDTLKKYVSPEWPRNQDNFYAYRRHADLLCFLKACQRIKPLILSKKDASDQTGCKLLTAFQTAEKDKLIPKDANNLSELIGCFMDKDSPQAVPAAEAPLGGGEAGSYGQGTAAAALFGGVATCAAPRAAAGTSSAQGGSSSSSSSSSDDEEEAAAAPPLGSVQSQPDGRSSFRSSL